MKKKTYFLMLVAVVMLVLPYAAIAQNLPDPDTVTIVTKTSQSTSTWGTIHTVAQGKTFYLMGATCSGGTRVVSGLFTDSCAISFNGGASTDFSLPSGHTISASYPIASSSSRSDIMIKNLNGGPDINCTIFGYEK